MHYVNYIKANNTSILSVCLFIFCLLVINLVINNKFLFVNQYELILSLNETTQVSVPIEKKDTFTYQF